MTIKSLFRRFAGAGRPPADATKLADYNVRAAADKLNDAILAAQRKGIKTKLTLARVASDDLPTFSVVAVETKDAAERTSRRSANPEPATADA